MMFEIEAARLFDGQRMISGGVVVRVDGGRIHEVLPATHHVPDVTLLPGLIDTHVHLCCDSGPRALDRLPTFDGAALTTVIEKALAEHLAAGVTTVRDLGDMRWAVIDWRNRNRDNTAFPTVLGSGPPITSSKGHCWNMGGEAESVDDLRRAVAERATRGVDVVKVMASGGVNTPGTDTASAQFNTEQIQAVVDEAHISGLRVTAHAHALQAIRNALAAGVDAIEHCTFLTGAGLEIDDTVVAEMAAMRIPVCPTIGIRAGATLPPDVLEMQRKTGITLEARAQTVAALHRAGVRLISGSDGGISPGKPHGILPESVIAMAHATGSPTGALISATSAAAAACGAADRKGRAVAGFDADLLVVDGDPVTDITALRQVRAVYARGRRAG
jgi:imidazolonepropionase-like amidohydrolase